jgi:hypothetical protein
VKLFAFLERKRRRLEEKLKAVGMFVFAIVFTEIYSKCTPFMKRPLSDVVVTLDKALGSFFSR